MGPSGVMAASGGEGNLRASDKRGTGNCDELHADMYLTCSLRCGRRTSRGYGCPASCSGFGRLRVVLAKLMPCMQGWCGSSNSPGAGGSENEW